MTRAPGICAMLQSHGKALNPRATRQSRKRRRQEAQPLPSKRRGIFVKRKKEIDRAPLRQKVKAWAAR